MFLMQGMSAEEVKSTSDDDDDDHDNLSGKTLFP
jgi:hypothetical protein